MSVHSVKKIHILGHNAIKDELVGSLLKLGAIEVREVSLLKEISKREESEEEFTGKLSELEFGIDFLDKHQPDQGFFERLNKGKPLFSQEEERKVLEEFDHSKWLQKIRGDFREIHQLTNQETEIKDRIALLNRWKGLGETKLSDIQPTRKVDILTGKIPSRAFITLESHINDKLPECALNIISKGKSYTLITIFILKEKREETLKQIKEIGFEEESLGSEKETVSELLESLQKERESLTLKREETINFYRDKVKEKFYLMLIYDHLAAEVEKKAAEKRFFTTNSVFALEGWIPKQDIARFEKTLSSFREIEWYLRDPEEGENPPVLMDNNKLVKPFEVITDLYGVPQYREIDPTPWLAPFFALSFGICISDGGYGLIIILMMYILKKILKPSGGAKKLFNLLSVGGCVAVVVGILTGGFFGIEFQNFPPALAFLKHARDKLIIFEPMKDQMTFFAIVLAFGFFQVFVGFFLKAYCRIKAGCIMDAVYDQFSWHLIMIGAGLYLLSSFLQIIPPVWGKIGGYTFCLGGAIVILFAGRENKNPLIRLASGIYSFYGVSGILGDVLSYSRLLALGIASGVIAGVVNTLAFMVLGIPYVGIVLMILVIIIGHLYNIAISMLGAFVHSTRLQFLEFFTKFYEGGGERFHPFSITRKYTVLREDLALNSRKN